MVLDVLDLRSVPFGMRCHQSEELITVDLAGKRVLYYFSAQVLER